jgi:hypothetical protein
MTMRTPLLVALLVTLVGSAAHADLTGATVNVSAYYPDTGTLFVDPGDVVVSGALEYPAGSYDPYTNSVAIDITDTQIILDDTTNNALPAAPAAFNGYILRVVSGPGIATATVDPASAWKPVELTVVNGEVRINYQGLAVKDFPGRFSIINYTVPEPDRVALAATGLLVFAACLAVKSRIPGSRGGRKRS